MLALAEFGIPTVVLGGAVELNEDAVGGIEWARVLQRPYTIGSVADAVQKFSKIVRG